VRADRLVSLVLLLRQRGRMTAGALARELEVSTRTVLRDVEALSAAGVPIYADRGRHGGFALLPGWEVELTGLSHDETLALLVAGRVRGEHALGLGLALSSAVRKVVDALPTAHRATAGEAARRLLVEPAADLVTALPRIQAPPAGAVDEVRRAVLAGHRLRIHYAAAGQSPQWRTVDPLGLVTVSDRAYLLATRAGADRTYRLSRILAAQGLPEPAQRPDGVDLDRLWRDRCAQYLSEVDRVTALVRVTVARRELLADAALAVRTVGRPDGDDLLVEVTYQDRQHAEWALWRLAEEVEVLTPQWLRAGLHDRASTIAARHTHGSGSETR
jgi:predicted DNA-binding transcriptional regulator YafY